MSGPETELNISSPRDYQRKLFTIVWLPTGSGKTLIALMLLKHYIVKDMKKKCFFLVPTVALGIQQFEYLNGNLPCKVSFVYGGRNVDQWSRETWYTEIEEHQCFVMTPQLFLDGHRHALIDKSLISVVVFDECHHAVKGHPYKLIMNELQENLANIRILGLSASPSSASTIGTIESIYQSKIIMPDDEKEMEQFSPNPDVTICSYSNPLLIVETRGLVDELQLVLEEFGSGGLNINEVSNFVYPMEPIWSDKIMKLVDILKGQMDNDPAFRCAIFVKKRLYAAVLTVILEKLLPNVVQARTAMGFSLYKRKSSFGTLFEVDSVKSIDDFRSGVANILVATSVAEEGIDIPQCNVVIRYDLPTNMISLVQSRGRARQKNSKYILMLNTCITQHKKMLEKIHEEEEAMAKAAKANLNEPIKEFEVNNLLDTTHFISETTGAKLTPRSALHVLNRYCQTLSSDGYTSNRPIITYKPDNGRYLCSIILPATSLANLDDLPPPQSYSTKKLAKSFAAFEICKILYKQEYLNQNLLPDIDDLLKKRRERKILSSSVQFNIQASFLKHPANINNDRFVGIPIFKKDKNTGISECLFSFLLSCDNTNLASSILSQLSFEADSCYIYGGSQFVLNDLCAEEIRIIRHYTITAVSVLDPSMRNGDYFDHSLPYAILPMRGCEIDWQSVYSTIANSYCMPMPKAADTNVIIFMLVRGGGKRFAILNKVLPERVDSPLPENMKIVLGRETFYEQLSKKYENVNPNDLLVNISPINPANLLSEMEIDCENSETKMTKTKASSILSKQFTCLSICSLYPITLNFYHHLRFLPLVIHGLSFNAAMIQFPFKNCISNYFILREALTDCHIDPKFNYERLETLGDSVLKFLTSIHVFTENPTKSEGFLTVWKDNIVCNHNLCILSKNNQFNKYLISSNFTTGKKWKSPGFATDKHVGSFRINDKRLSDLVESLLGASYIDGGFTNCLNFLGIINIYKTSIPKSMDIYYQNAYKSILFGSQVDISDYQGLLLALSKALGVAEFPTEFYRLFLQSISHPSNINGTGSLQRLEFLGDPVLDFTITEHLFLHSYTLSTLQMTILRSNFVNQVILGHLSFELGLPQLLIHANESISSINATFKKARNSKSVFEKPPIINAKSIKEAWLNMFKPPLPPKLYCDIYESVLGAYFLSYGWEAAKALIHKHFKKLFDLFLHPDIYIPRFPAIGYLEHKFGKELLLHFFEVPLDADENWVVTNIESLKASESRGDKFCSIGYFKGELIGVFFSFGCKRDVEIAISVCIMEKYMK